MKITYRKGQVMTYDNDTKDTDFKDINTDTVSTHFNNQVAQVSLLGGFDEIVFSGTFDVSRNGTEALARFINKEVLIQDTTTGQWTHPVALFDETTLAYKLEAIDHMFEDNDFNKDAVALHDFDTIQRALGAIQTYKQEHDIKLDTRPIYHDRIPGNTRLSDFQP